MSKQRGSKAEALRDTGKRPTHILGVALRNQQLQAGVRKQADRVCIPFQVASGKALPVTKSCSNSDDEMGSGRGRIMRRIRAVLPCKNRLCSMYGSSQPLQPGCKNRL